MHRSLSINELWKKAGVVISKLKQYFLRILASETYFSSFLFESSSLNEEDQWNGQNTLINIEDHLFCWAYNEEVLFKPY